MGQKIGSWVLWGAIAYMVLFVGFCGGPSLGQRGAIAAYDLRTLDDPGAPTHATLAANRDRLRLEIAEKNEQLKSMSLADPNRHRIMREIKELELEEKKLTAELNGETLSESPAMVIEASHFGWQTINCVNRQNQTKSCEFFPGDVIEGSRRVTSSTVRLVSNNQPAEIGPLGLSEQAHGIMPFIPDLPRFALIGQMMDEAGNEIGKPFVIGSHYTVTAHCFIKAMVNGDYWSYKIDPETHKKIMVWPHDEWFAYHYQSSFAVRKA